MKIGQYCQRQRCRHVELEQFWQAFATRGFVSDSWAFLYLLLQIDGLCNLITDFLSFSEFFYSITFYPRDGMLARVIVIATCLSVRPSVRPSVTRRYCVKTKKASGMVSSPSGSPKTLVFWCQISSPNSKGFPPKRGPQRRVGRKNSAIFQIYASISPKR